MALIRIRAAWTGFNGGPGYNILHFDTGSIGAQAGAQIAADRLGTFYNAIKAYWNMTVTVRPEGSAEVIDENSGRIEDIVSVTPPPAASGAATTGFAGVSGAVMHLGTDGVKNGRRVRGKMFLVPLASAIYENNGTLLASGITAIEAAGNQLIGNNFDANLVVYSRPINNDGGTKHDVVSVRVPDKACILRSRRD